VYGVVSGMGFTLADLIGWLPYANHAVVMAAVGARALPLRPTSGRLCLNEIESTF
jgi:hypothetical protein